MITEKLINKFLLFLYNCHIEEYGDSLAELPNSAIHVLNKSFPNECPEAIINIDENTIKDLTHNLATELKLRGLAEYESLVVNLTPEGFKKAKRLKHPIKSFISTHWAWSLGIFLTIINTVVTVVRLLLCP